MSNGLAIAAVTSTLKLLLESHLNLHPVSTFPPDKARNGNTGDQINLFLYHTAIDAAWRNMDIPYQVRPGEIGQPPLPLNLFYLITAYGEGDDDIKSHRLLGRAMSVLHDHPLLGRAEIELIVPDSELQNQVERVRITFQPMSLDEMSKLWMIFQTQYRISTAYQVSVVLIDSSRTTQTALPVLKRNIAVRPFRQPVIDEILPATDGSLPAAIMLGSQLKIKGQNLQGNRGDVVKVSFGTEISTVPPDSISAKQILVTLSDTLHLLAGINGAQVVQQIVYGTPLDPKSSLDELKAPVKPLPSDPHSGFESNIMPFVLSPTITRDNTGIFNITPEEVGGHTAKLTITLSPEVGKSQRVVLLLDEFNPPTTRAALAYSFNAPPRDKPNDPPTSPSIAIPISGVALGQYLVRVQVDGAESQLTMDTDKNSPTFNQFNGPQVAIK